MYKRQVQEVWIPTGGRRRDALLAGALCNDARLEWRAGAPAAQGDPTEGALIVAAAREGLDRNKLDEQWPRQGELPFDSGRKLMSTIHPLPEGGFRVFVKGAPDVLLERCAAGPQGPDVYKRQPSPTTPTASLPTLWTRTRSTP